MKIILRLNCCSGPVKYVDKDGKDSEVLKIYGQERAEGEGVASPDIQIPGVLDLFTVVWSNPFGDITDMLHLGLCRKDTIKHSNTKKVRINAYMYNFINV